MFAASVAFSWTSNAFSPESLPVRGCSCDHRSPPPCDGSSFSRGANPFQSPSLPPDRPTCRPVSTSLEFRSLQRPLELAPSRGGLSTTAPVPLPGFLNLSAASASAGPSPVALFHATTVPRIRPSELSPRRNRAPLSRPLATLQLSTRVQKCTVQVLVTAGLLRLPRFHAVAWPPPTAMSFL